MLFGFLASSPQANFFYWIPTQRNRDYAAAKATVRGTLATVIESKRASIAKGGGNLHEDVLSAMLATSDGDAAGTAAHGGGGDDALIDNLLTFFFGGYDTTSVALSFALFEIADRPEVEARLVEEVDQVLGKVTHPSPHVCWVVPASSAAALRRGKRPCFGRRAGAAGVRVRSAGGDLREGKESERLSEQDQLDEQGGEGKGLGEGRGRGSRHASCFLTGAGQQTYHATECRAWQRLTTRLPT